MQKSTLQFLAAFTCLLLAFNQNSNAQSEALLQSYEDYIEAPREVAYAHLNKSTYIKGEIMGFTAYVMDKFTKVPSKMTTNLYCTIADEAGNVIKKKLIQVKNGVSANTFDVDSTLSTGIFTFKAYTNWMRNFDEQNHFEQTFKVIDADELSKVKPVSAGNIKVDLQILGEGGHILYNTPNTVGIIAKNQFGNGIANAFGNITDASGNVLTEFQLNEVGLAKTVFTPILNTSYNVNLNLNAKTVSTPIKEIKANGIVMSLTALNDKVNITVKTNGASSKQVKKNNYKIALHNGDNMVVSPFKLNDNNVALLSFAKDQLFSGINIFTIFTEDDEPLLERLYFNASKINQQNIENVSLSRIKDSLDISLNLNNVSTSDFSHLSISVLPSDTKSYNHHNNLLSQLYIQPYIKGKLENASRYFKTNDRKTEYEIDLVMLTQGWSSYNWNTIFSDNEREFKFAFERGIDIIANVNAEKPGTYLVYPLAENNTQFFEVPKSEKVFTVKTSFPSDDDLFRIGYINTKKKEFKEKPSLYLQFYPSEFPAFKNTLNVIEEAYTANETSINPNQDLKAWSNNDVTELDAVVIEGQTKETKAEALQKKAFRNRLDYIDDSIKLRNLRLDLYLQRLGWVTQYDYFSGTLSITNPRVNWGTNVPLVYLDNAFLTGSGLNSDFSILTFLYMQDIEYIEYELYGSGGGIRGNAGFIKIKTSPSAKNARRSNNVTTYDIPLRFSEEKTFYTPQYLYYNTEFFREYGTIAWKPSIGINSDGKAQFKIFDTKTKNITLFVEGIVNDDTYISQEINVELND